MPVATPPNLADELGVAPKDMLALRGIVRGVMLDSDTLTGTVKYQVPVGEINPVSVALPPGFEPGFKP